MDLIKEAFSKAKKDIQNLKEEILLISKEFLEIKRTLLQQTDKPTHIMSNQPNISNFPTDNTRFSENLSFKALKTQNLNISTGNDRVPTDRQTDKPTDRQTLNEPLERVERIRKMSSILDSLDTIKKDLRNLFIKLTNQEAVVFSLIYQLEEQGFVVDYPLLAQKLSLSESSIRDYIQKMIKKGIPIQKNKENNKKIILKIDSSLKKITTLNTILSLRNLK